MSITIQLEQIIKTKEEDLHKLKVALGVLKGLKDDLPEAPGSRATEMPPSSPEPVVPELPTTIAKKVDTRPECSSCMGKMDSYVTKMPSGMLVQHLKCTECGNEKY